LRLFFDVVNSEYKVTSTKVGYEDGKPFRSN
jgi:hypothetical protein